MRDETKYKVVAPPTIEEQLEELGQKIVDMLALEPNEKGRYDTEHGDKTLMGLGKMVTRFVSEM